jgi:hypothetical protein
VETLAYSPARGVFSPWPKTLFHEALETGGFPSILGIASSMAENFSFMPSGKLI